MPEMVSQKFLLGTLLHLPIIDPTCGRYCLKALLKYCCEVNLGIRPEEIELPRPASRIKDWVAYDPYNDFQYAAEMLEEPDNIPTSIASWINLLRTRGPIILNGVLGTACVSHFILLVGADSDEPQKFFYKDPLVGDEVKNEAFATMQERIKCLTYAKLNIGLHLTKFLRIMDFVNIAFQPPQLRASAFPSLTPDRGRE
jgi:hypothetical protein